jgi:CubicO group peptidase (beta-lactamase class C family)
MRPRRTGLAFAPSGVSGVIALVVASLAAPCSAQKPAKPGKLAPPGPAIVDGELGKELDAIVLAFDQAGGGFSGIVLAARGGRIALEKGYGLHDAAAEKAIDASSLWDWASVSKQFTAAAVLRLVDKKKLSLDDPLSKHWPKVPADKKKVTVRHLLNHTSGIQSGFRAEWKFDSSRREALEQQVLGLPMASEPGSKFDYSNSSYALAAALVERISGKTFEEFCVTELFRPAGMKDACLIGWQDLDLERVPRIARGAGFTDRPKEFRFAYGNTLTWGYRGCGGAVATARDMLAWDQALRGTKLLSAAAKKDLYTVGKDDYALGWTRKRLPCGEAVSHSGGVLGVVTMYYRLLDEDVCVALACNYEPKASPEQLAQQLLTRAAK